LSAECTSEFNFVLIDWLPFVGAVEIFPAVAP
jgi:hypothetical protein